MKETVATLQISLIYFDMFAIKFVSNLEYNSSFHCSNK